MITILFFIDKLNIFEFRTNNTLLSMLGQNKRQIVL